MQDLREALADIHVIRSQLARGAQFRGYGPKSIAAGGILALALAAAESILASHAEHNAALFLTVWIPAALVALALAACETALRSQRIHLSLSRQMLQSAVEQFLPPMVVAVLLTVVFVRAIPDQAWMLPGLWQICFSLGIFASCRFLPRPIFAVGLWYLVCGLLCLCASSASHALSPWEMGVPFGVGQLLVALMLQLSYEKSDN